MKGFPFLQASMRSADMGHLADQIEKLEKAGIDGLHFDVIDGRFGPEISLGLCFVRGLRKYSQLPFEVHLLVEQPEKCLDSYIEAGANQLIVHVETTQNPVATLAHIHSRGCRTGLAINPETSIEALKPYLNICDKINVMTIDPMIPGQLNERGLNNLTKASQLVTEANLNSQVQADGAVSLKSRETLLKAGANSMVVGYPLFSSHGFRSTIESFRTGLHTSSLTTST